VFYYRCGNEQCINRLSVTAVELQSSVPSYFVDLCSLICLKGDLYVAELWFGSSWTVYWLTRPCLNCLLGDLNCLLGDFTSAETISWVTRLYLNCLLADLTLAELIWFDLLFNLAVVGRAVLPYWSTHTQQSTKQNTSSHTNTQQYNTES